MNRFATARLPVAAFATLAGALVAVLSGVIDGALLVAPWAVLLVLGIARTRPTTISGTISTPTERVVAGDTIRFELTIGAATGWLRAAPLPSAEFWGPEPGANAARTHALAEVLHPERPIHTGCDLPADEWGAHDVGRAHLEVTEPYGLFRWVGELRQPTRVGVHPTPTQLRSLLAPHLVRRTAGSHASKAADRGVEYADLRQFAAGDSLRDVNWRASARSEGLWVSQRHPDRATDVVLLLDSFVESGHDAREVVGLAVQAAVALGESHLAMTDRVGLIELGGVVRWVSPRPGIVQLQRLTDALLATRLYASAAERNLSIIPPRALPPRSFVVALSPLIDGRFIDALFVLAGQGHDVAVIECPPSSPHELPTTSQNEARAVAVRLLEAEREMLRDRLAEHGVAIARWDRGDHLEAVVAELSRRRARTRGVVRR